MDYEQCIVVQRQRSRNYNGLNYYKYRITIPVQIAEYLRLKGGERLDIHLEKNKIVIRKSINLRKNLQPNRKL